MGQLSSWRGGRKIVQSKEQASSETESEVHANKQELADLYRQMYLIRQFEEACGEMYPRGRVRGFLHLYIGEEAIAVGAISQLLPHDHIVTHFTHHDGMNAIATFSR